MSSHGSLSICHCGEPRFCSVIGSNCVYRYREAAPTLYSSHNFSFGSIKTLELFSQSIPGHRLQQIRSISFRDVNFDLGAVLDPDQPAPACSWYYWPDLLKILPSMQGLRKITFHYVISNGNYERHLSDPAFLVFDELPTDYLHPACTVEYKVEEPSDSMLGGTEHIDTALHLRALERWWAREYSGIRYAKDELENGALWIGQ